MPAATGRQLDQAVYLLPLRAFLGITYVYAACQKLHDPGFLDPSAPGSFAAQTAAFKHSSPIGFALGPAHVAIPATGAVQLTAPGGDPVFVSRTADGGYKACSGICTHAGCPVGIDQAKGVLACPCHGSTFDPKTGAVITGPAKDPLPSFPVTVTDGVLRVQKA
ncbi:MAG: Rieske (2Fe-2S) protein [Catenulispora sp.]|nr:Rieske (2Fe-2S) protein [Catenulispora sp.]